MKLKMIDSHCHLQDDDYAEDREQVYERTIGEQVGMIIPGYTMASSEAAIRFVNEHEGTWALLGIHPHDAKMVEPRHLQTVEEWARGEPKVVGIGEIGLDYHYNHSLPEVQRVIFQQQLDLAKRLDVPAAVHTREAEEDTVTLIQEAGVTKGVIHCFTGSLVFAEQMVQLGWYISFSGAITFKSAHGLRDVVSHVPLHRILIETDSPYLSPVPWRGQRNEPLRVVRIAEIIAAQKNCSTQQVFSQTLSNTISLFSVTADIG